MRISDWSSDVCSSDLERFGQRAGHWLFADDVDAVAREGLDGGRVEGIGREDGDGFDAIGAGGLGGGHGISIGVGALKRDACGLGGGVGARLGGDRKRVVWGMGVAVG